MTPPANCEKKLETVYKYFSHHMRTNTAVIVAMLEAVNDGLSDDSVMSMIMESGFLLDLFDRGMSVSFNHIFEKPECSEEENVDIFMLIKLFTDHGVSKESGVEVNIGFPENTTIRCEPYSLKSLLQILMHECALVAQSGIDVSLEADSLKLAPDSGFFENPPVMQIFKEIFADQGIDFEYNKNFFLLRFPNESINCR